MFGFAHAFLGQLLAFAPTFLVLVFRGRFGDLAPGRARHGIPAGGLGERLDLLLLRVEHRPARQLALGRDEQLAGLPDGHRPTEFVDDGELAACFARADVVVLPYREIDQSGVLATALAFGSPLVLTDVGGFAEVAAVGAARLVAPGDPPALREALTELLGDSQARERLRAGARALAGGEWSWQRTAERTKALYSSLLS